MTTQDNKQPWLDRIAVKPDIRSDKLYQVRLSVGTEDPEWDNFLAKTPNGNHAQSSDWAKVKTVQNWKSLRIIITEEKNIVAGAQMLYRHLPVRFAGSYAHVPKGPVFAKSDPALAALLFKEIKKQVLVNHIRHLVVHPPESDNFSKNLLSELGFRLFPLSFAPSSTVLIDLDKKPEEILALMKPKTRYNLRKAQRQGITVREGDINDLKTFQHLLESTAKRQNFSAESPAYFLKLWHTFYPKGNLKLFITEHHGQDLSAALIINFGNTVIYNRGCWYSQNKSLKPNELMHWHGIQWAKSHGFRYYDFEGIERKTAEAIISGKFLSVQSMNSVSRFKLGFGGKVILKPLAYAYIPNLILDFVNKLVFEKLLQFSVVEKTLNWIRTR